MSTRPLNPRATVMRFDGTSWLPVKDLHIDIQFNEQPTNAPNWQKLFACETTPGVFPTIIDTTAEVLPLEQEEGARD